MGHKRGLQPPQTRASHLCTAGPRAALCLCSVVRRSLAGVASQTMVDTAYFTLLRALKVASKLPLLQSILQKTFTNTNTIQLPVSALTNMNIASENTVWASRNLRKTDIYDGKRLYWKIYNVDLTNFYEGADDLLTQLAGCVEHTLFQTTRLLQRTKTLMGGQRSRK